MIDQLIQSISHKKHKPQGERSINHTLFIDGFLMTFLGMFLTLNFFICSFGSVFHNLIFITFASLLFIT